MSDASLTAVAKTALGVALIRAFESGQPNRLFDDPYAAAFAKAAVEAFVEEQADQGYLALGALFSFHVVVRTRFFDEYLLAACANGCRQVVLLAAGLDARAFRLAWPQGIRLFELDLPEIFAFKEPVLAERGAEPCCERIVLPVDLREDWPAQLLQAGFDATGPTAWMAEGLLSYLTPEEVSRLLEQLGSLAAPGSQLSIEQSSVTKEMLRAKTTSTPVTDRFMSIWHGGLGKETASWLASHGWSVQKHERAALATSYGRPAPESSPGGFIQAFRI